MNGPGNIEAFVTRFLTTFGATVKPIGRDSPQSIHVRLSAELARSLETDRVLRLSFKPTKENAQYITIGHPLLDRMLTLARGRGQTSNLLFSLSIAPDFVQSVMTVDPFNISDDDNINKRSPENGLVAEFIRQAQRVRINEGRLRTVDRKIVHQRQVLFFFKVSMISDEKREEIIPLLIDPLTETVDRPVDLQHTVSFEMPAFQGNVESEDYAIERLYRVACRRLEKRLKGRMDKFAHEAAQRAEQEKRRIDDYYRGLAEENLEPLRNLFRRISSAGVRAEMARTWQTEQRIQNESEVLKKEVRALEEVYRSQAQELERERVQRIFEVSEKYRSRTEIELTHAAYVMVPRIVWDVRLTRDRIRRGMELVYDVLRRRFVNWQCEHCEEPLTDSGYLCSCDGVVCRSCHFRCSSCGQYHCYLCRDERCHLCDGVTCLACDSTCPAGIVDPDEGSDGIKSLKVCFTCRNDWCDPCQKLQKGWTL